MRRACCLVACLALTVAALARAQDKPEAKPGDATPADTRPAEKPPEAKPPEAKAPEGPRRVEYVRVPLYSVFHPDKDTEARGERALYLSGPRMNSADFRIPVEVPVGAQVVEVGLVGQTSNQMSVRLERTDWTPVYVFGETTPKEAGAWTCLAVVEHQLVRKVGKPVPDDDKNPTPRRETEEQEFTVTISLARSPAATKEEKNAYANAQRDKVTAVWLKILR